MTNFYDTCSLLFLQQKVFEDESKFYISNVTLKELESIKSSYSKDEEQKYQARKVIDLLGEYEDKYEVIIFNSSDNHYIEDMDLPFNNDSQIITCALKLKETVPDLIFNTQDKCCAELAKRIAKLQVKYHKKENYDEYNGYKILKLNNIQLASFYSYTLQENMNLYRLHVNEYLLIEYEGEIIEAYVWTKEEKYKKIEFLVADSKMFGKIKPRDYYQQIAFHSLFNNQLTMLRGKAGTGKTLLSFSYMFQLLETGKIDKIIVFCNTVATKGSAKLGFYPGDRTEKLLDSQIGNLLISKIGDKMGVEDLIDKGQLILLPLSDIRGFDTTGMNACVYISEAQNLDIELMRLALQRIGSDSKCIIDGDFSHQVDMSIYAGDSNGMRRVSQIFRGHDCYGEVELNKIYRSGIAEIAEQM